MSWYKAGARLKLNIKHLMRKFKPHARKVQVGRAALALVSLFVGICLLANGYFGFESASSLESAPYRLTAEERAKGERTKQVEEAKAYLAKDKDNGDGTRTAVISSTPVKYKDAQGNWQPIDVNIEQVGSKLKVTEAGYNLLFDTDARKPVTFKVGSREIKFTPADEANLSLAGVSGNKATYKDVYENTDLERVTTPDGIKQNYILKTFGHPVSFSETLSTSLFVKEEPDGSIGYYDGGEKIAASPKPYLTDAEGRKRDCNYEWRVESGELILELPSLDGLTYPITVDPSTTKYPSQDTYIFSNSPFSNYGYASSLMVSYSTTSGQTRSLIQFNIGSLSGVYVNSAILKLYKKEGDNSATVIGRQITSSWTEYGVTWNSHPGMGSTAGWTTVTTSTGWFSWDITSTVQNWIDYPSTNYGVLLYCSTGGSYFYANFYSRQYSNPAYRPKLEITYILPPNAPTNPGGTAISPSQINWTCTDNSTDETGFRVHDSSHATKASVATTTQGTTGTIYTIQETGLSPNRSYTRHIHAYNLAGDSPATSSLTRYTLANLPTNPSASTASSTEVNLSWDANSNPADTQYYAQRATDASFTQNVSGSGWVTGTSYNFTGLSPNTLYYFRVKARNGDNIETSYSPIVQARTYAAVPVNLSLLPEYDAIDGYHIHVNWGTGSGQNHYHVRSSSDNFASIKYDGTDTTYKETDLVFGNTYTYRVSAVNDDGIEGETVWIQTTESDFNTGTLSDTQVTGIGQAAAIKLASGETTVSVYADASDGLIGYSNGVPSWLNYNVWYLLAGPHYYYDDVLDWEEQNWYRAFVKFPLLSITGQVTSATLNMYNYGYSSGSSPYPDLIVDRISNFDILDWSDWSIDTYSSNIGTLVSGSDTSLGWKSLDITSQVEADRTAGRSFTSYRVRGATEPTASGRYFNFYSADNAGITYDPYLSVTYKLIPTAYYTSGTFTSSVKDTGSVTNFGAISWAETKPPGTNITMQVRTGNSPDCSDGTWIDISNGQMIPGSLDNKRYIQYKATLTSDGSDTPTLSEVDISYGSGAYASAAVSFVAPDTPTTFLGIANSPSAITWSWTNVQGEAGYKVYAGAHDVSEITSLQTLGRDVVSWQETGLSPNTTYTRHLHAYNSFGASNATDAGTRRTLSPTPDASSITCDKGSSTWYNNPLDPDFTFTNNLGFDEGGVEYFKFVWNKDSSYTFSGTETSKWSSGTLTLSATSAGKWYLHVQGYNGDDVANGDYTYGPYFYDSTPPTSFGLISPPDGSSTEDTDPLFETTPLLSWQASNDGTGSGLAKYQLYINGELNRDNISPSTTSTRPSASLDPGSYTWYVVATDIAGNSTTSPTWNFNVPLIDVASIITSPADDSHLRGTECQIKGTAAASIEGSPTPLSKVEISTDGGLTWQECLLDYWSWTQTSVSDFNAGSLSDTQVSGTGDSATVKLGPYTVYTTSGDDTFAAWDSDVMIYSSLPLQDYIRTCYDDGTTSYRGYLRFPLPGISSPITSAKLSLWEHATYFSNDVPYVYHSAPMNPGIDSGETLWNTPKDTLAIGNLGNLDNQYNTIDVTTEAEEDRVAGRAYTYFQLWGTTWSSYAYYYSADYGSNKPKLEITTADPSYAPSGTFTSSIKDTSGASNFDTISWNPTTQPIGTNITIQVRAGDTSEPDGSWTSWQDVANDGEIPSALDGNRYIQYKATLTASPDHSATPTLSNITINYTPTGGTPTDPVHWRYNWTLPADGIYNIKTRATDEASHVETPSEGITVTVDNTSPEAKITSPEAGATLPELGIVDISGTATDANLKQYKLEYSYEKSLDVWGLIGTYTNPVTDGLLGSVKVNNFRYGAYTFRLTVEDKAGNTSITTVSGISHFVSNPHISYTLDTDTCAVCHLTHTAVGKGLVNKPFDFLSTFCYSCHDGTGSKYDIKTAFDANPSHHPIQDSYYANLASGDNVDNLVTNASFEIDSNSDGAADNWTYTYATSGGYTDSLDSTTSIYGDYSQKAVIAGGQSHRLYQVVSVIPGKTYTFTGWIRTTSANGNWNDAMIRIDDDQTWGIDLGSYRPQASNTWEKYTTTFTATTSSIYIIAWFGTTNATVNFDGFEVARHNHELSCTDCHDPHGNKRLDGSYYAKLLNVKVPSENLCTNPSFETDTTRWSSAGYSTLTRITTDSVVGNASLQVTMNAGKTTNIAIWDNITSSINQGDLYTFSAYVKGTGNTVGATGRITIRAVGGAQGAANIGSKYFTYTSSWQRVEASGAVDYADRVELDFWIRSLNGTEGNTIYIDGVEVQRGEGDSERVHEGNDFCGACHGSNSLGKGYQLGGDHITNFSGVAAHDLKMPEPESGTKIKCTTKCHTSHGSQNAWLTQGKQENFCLDCHTIKLGEPPTSLHNRDIKYEFSLTSSHDAPCTSCHGPHTVRAEEGKLLTDPENTKNLWTSSEIQFCLKCHDGVPPKATITTSKIIPYNISFPGDASLYDKSNFALRNLNLHNNIRCGICHTSHGSQNQSLVGLMGDFDTTYQGVAFCKVCHSDPPAEGLPPEAQDAPPYDWGSSHQQLCSECHDPHQATSNPLIRDRNCQSCHVRSNHADAPCETCHTKNIHYSIGTDQKSFCGLCHPGGVDQQFSMPNRIGHSGCSTTCHHAPPSGHGRRCDICHAVGPYEEPERSYHGGGAPLKFGWVDPAPFGCIDCHHAGFTNKHWGEDLVINPYTGPTIYEPITLVTTSDSATISWNTDSISDSVVEYGVGASYEEAVWSNVYTRNHSLTITGLNRGTTYHFRVSSMDIIRTFSSDFTFTTQP